MLSTTRPPLFIIFYSVVPHSTWGWNAFNNGKQPFLLSSAENYIASGSAVNSEEKLLFDGGLHWRQFSKTNCSNISMILFLHFFYSLLYLLGADILSHLFHVRVSILILSYDSDCLGIPDWTVMWSNDEITALGKWLYFTAD